MSRIVEDSATGKTYVYSHEIAQMMFVFVEVAEASDEVLKLIEDIVQAQCVELLIQARRLAIRRSSKFLAAEDLIFLIRHDKPKVNRLRTYLSWKDVRKNAKDSGGDAAAPGGGEGIDALEEGAMDTVAKAHMMKLRLPWDLNTIYTDNLSKLQAAGDQEEEDDEDDLEAQEASLQRLKEADDATRTMTREEYVHYSECRQASFTWRKGKRFREFINAGAYIDVKPNDDIIDILGFLAYEVVRELCIKAVGIRDAEEERRQQGKTDRRKPANQNAAAAAADPSDTSQESIGQAESASAALNGDTPGQLKRKRAFTIDSIDRSAASPQKRARTIEGAVGDGGQSTAGPGDGNGTSQQEDSAGADAALDGELCSLFTMPPSKHIPLTPVHVQEAFARVQRGNAVLVNGDMPGPPGGLRRTRLFVI